MINYFHLGEDQGFTYVNNILYYTLTHQDNDFILLKGELEADSDTSLLSAFIRMSDRKQYIVRLDFNENIMYLHKALYTDIGPKIEDFVKFESIPFVFEEHMAAIQAKVVQIVSDPQTTACSIQYEKQQLAQWYLKRPYSNEALSIISDYRSILSSASNNPLFPCINQIADDIAMVKHDVHVMYVVIIVLIVLNIIGVLLSAPALMDISQAFRYL